MQEIKFMDACKYEERLWTFLEDNSLISFDLESVRVKAEGHIEGVSQISAKKVFILHEEMYIVKADKVGIIKCVKGSRKIGAEEFLYTKDTGPVKTAFYHNDRIIVIPVNIDAGIYIFSLEDMRYTVEKIDEVKGYVLSVKLHDGMLWFSIKGKNVLFSYDVDLKILKSNAISQIAQIATFDIRENDFWIGTSKGTTIYKWDSKNNNVTEYLWEGVHEENPILVATGRYVFLLPILGNAVYALDTIDERFVRVYELTRDTVTDRKAFFVGSMIEKDRLFLFPWAGAMIEINVSDLSVKEHRLIIEKGYAFWKKMIMGNTPVLIEDNNVGLEEFMDFLSSDL